MNKMLLDNKNAIPSDGIRYRMNFPIKAFMLVGVAFQPVFIIT